MYSNQLPQLPRHADAQHYAEWAVRRIGRAFAIAVFAPVVMAGVALGVVGDGEVVSAVFVLGSMACIAIAIGYLCFARAPR